MPDQPGELVLGGRRPGYRRRQERVGSGEPAQRRRRDDAEGEGDGEGEGRRLAQREGEPALDGLAVEVVPAEVAPGERAQLGRGGREQAHRQHQQPAEKQQRARAVALARRPGVEGERALHAGVDAAQDVERGARRAVLADQPEAEPARLGALIPHDVGRGEVSPAVHEGDGGRHGHRGEVGEGILEGARLGRRRPRRAPAATATRVHAGAERAQPDRRRVARAPLAEQRSGIGVASVQEHQVDGLVGAVVAGEAREVVGPGAGGVGERGQPLEVGPGAPLRGVARLGQAEVARRAVGRAALQRLAERVLERRRAAQQRRGGEGARREVLEKGEPQQVGRAQQRRVADEACADGADARAAHRQQVGERGVAAGGRRPDDAGERGRQRRVGAARRDARRVRHGLADLEERVGGGLGERVGGGPGERVGAPGDRGAVRGTRPRRLGQGGRREEDEKGGEAEHAEIGKEP